MIKIVIPISGGKDSQCCLKLALKEYKPSEILGLFCDTKFEHPITYKHIERMRRNLYGVKIHTIRPRSHQYPLDQSLLPLNEPNR